MVNVSKHASHALMVVIVHLGRLAIMVNVILRIIQRFLLKAPLVYVQKHMEIVMLDPVVTMMVDSKQV
jgi:hypothetical protein